MPAKIDLTGQRFTRWTVLGETRVNGALFWSCRCDCGGLADVMGWTLRAGRSRSCGCLGHEETRDRLTVHGLTKHPLFSVWKGMLTRCNNPNSNSFIHYGARGIVVSAEWRDDFGQFFRDMEPTWRRGLTIERDDNDGPYSKANCRWIPKSEQARNRSFCIYFDTPQGRLTMTEAARIFGISLFALRRRVRLGWPADQLLRPPAPGGRKKNESGSPDRRRIPSAEPDR